MADAGSLGVYGAARRGHLGRVFCEMRDKPKIDYPCAWEFRVIGADRDAMTEAIRHTLGDEQYTVRPGNRSPAGRWWSLSLELEVVNETHRYEIHRLLREHPAIRMVL